MPELHLHYRATRFTHFLPGRVPAEWPESVQSPEHGNRAMQRSSRDGDHIVGQGAGPDWKKEGIIYNS
ncbi:MAG: hypothetical protein OXC57_01495 [Rhodobacteraceae bacterium]|nr:hypothetical protein [Paracoccaceae bacterium]